MSKSGQTAGDEFVKGIKSKSSDAKNVGSEISKSLASGVTSSKSEVDNAVKKIIQDAINAIQNKKNEFQNKGQELIKELARGFDNAKSQVDNNIKKILQNCISSGNSFKGQFTTVGRNLANGIAQGISSGSGAIERAARNAVINAVNAAKKAGQIRSPSRIMKNQVGFYLSAGIAEGIKSGESLIEDANKKLINNAEKQYKKLIERGASKDVLKNYLGKNIEDALKYGNLLLNQSNLDFDKYNSGFKFIDKIKDEINFSKNLIEDAFDDIQFKFKIDNILSLSNNQKPNDDSKPITVNIYGANYLDRNEARNYGRELSAQIERERRRYGG